jgi:hypothetical protein
MAKIKKEIRINNIKEIGYENIKKQQMGYHVNDCGSACGIGGSECFCRT